MEIGEFCRVCRGPHDEQRHERGLELAGFFELVGEFARSPEGKAMLGGPLVGRYDGVKVYRRRGTVRGS